MSDTMRADFFAIKVTPEHRAAFVEASILKAQSVISEEAGVFEFHVLTDQTDHNRFYFYEVYRDDAALQAHRKTAVYKGWWRTVEPMIDGQVENIAKMHSLFPTGKGFQAQKPGLLQW